ncbi:DUF6364 family protein [Dyadobacter luticola]|uniref:Uncharacterized protein n=1 Tax=Dyadobacter luticola TaxID=1979387 RepID=A0A5R9KV49_9BACT|nr:DUF6364 family protein [Dyadobacter luticola]TLV00156.1 hypothetical protein FEN17_11655 [Dyadobacter luticola]
MKLTINIDEENFLKATQLAKADGDTVEHIIENFLKKMLDDRYQNAFPTSKEKSESSEVNAKLSAIETIARLQREAGLKPTPDFDEKEDFRNHIIRKHA